MKRIALIARRARLSRVPGWLGVGLAILLFTGCNSSLLRSKDHPRPQELVENVQVERLIGDLTSPWGITYQKVEAVALATELDGTGSDPPDDARRDMLISEMHTHDVKYPNQVLSWPSTSLVTVKGFLRPGSQKGDRFDLEVRVPQRSETTSLRGGFLMATRLRDIAIIDQQVHTGHVLAQGRGPVLIDAVFEGGQDKINTVRGRVLAGGICQTDRPLGLVVKKDETSIATSKLIGSAINNRFHTFRRGIKQGVATPKRDNFIEISIHPRYKHNLGRYMKVIRAIAVGRGAADVPARLQRLERMLLEPTTAAAAALQLEAIGTLAVEVLKRGVESPDPEVRFYSAEALAYLDEGVAAQALKEAADQQPAFRWHALAALAAMDHVAALDALTELMHVRSAETRYGAFHAIRTRTPDGLIARGEFLADEFHYHRVESNNEPLIHFTRRRRPEMVVFGPVVSITPPKFLYAGEKILITSTDNGELKISRFGSGDNDEYQVCRPTVDALTRAIVRLGGGYAEVIEAIHSAQQSGDLNARVLLDAGPLPGRTYRREDGEPRELPSYRVANPVPDLFANKLSDSDQKTVQPASFVQPVQPEPAKRGLLNRLGKWMSR